MNDAALAPDQRMRAVTQVTGEPRHRVALVTGAARGIGRAIARRLAEDGWAMTLSDRSDDLHSAAVALSSETENDRIRSHPCDVSVERDVDDLVAFAAQQYGRLDLVVVNAGVGGGSDGLADLSAENFDSLIAVNLRGCFLTLRAAAKAMLPQQSGSIITVGSVYGRVPVPGAAAYSASKAGLVALTKTAALELGPHGITVNAIAPGFIDTPMRREALRNRARLAGVTVAEVFSKDVASVPLRRYGTGEDVAGAVAFLAGEDSRYITGHVIEVTGGQPL